MRSLLLSFSVLVAMVFANPANAQCCAAEATPAATAAVTAPTDGVVAMTPAAARLCVEAAERCCSWLQCLLSGAWLQCLTGGCPPAPPGGTAGACCGG